MLATHPAVTLLVPGRRYPQGRAPVAGLRVALPHSRIGGPVRQMGVAGRPLSAALRCNGQAAMPDEHTPIETMPEHQAAAYTCAPDPDQLTPFDIVNGIDDQMQELMEAAQWLHKALQGAPGVTQAQLTIAAQLLAHAAHCSHMLEQLKREVAG
jgi:hypothetical protein